MKTLWVDGRAHQVGGENNLLHDLLQLGFDLPYFCWHPALGSVGACRQCAVKVFRNEQDTRGKVTMACMTHSSDGVRLSVEDAEAKAFRRATIEWLMLNHPHDCPVCDEGGECHLQDMTVMTGHAYRRNRFRKRTHRNQDLGPLVNHEMNRCIQCYRCVRFYKDYAQGTDFDVFGCHDDVYFGRREDGTLENEFSGNLVEVCPTGVFTDKTLKRHYTRKWDLRMAPSVCVHCGVGCNTSPGERYGMLRRIVNRYHGELNGYFLCDRGRYGYEFVNSPQRVRRAALGREKERHEASGTEAVRAAAQALSSCERLIGIGSPRASLESNFALRTLVGKDNFFQVLSPAELVCARRLVMILSKGPAPVASLKEVEGSDAVLVLGEDVTQTAPRLALCLRQAVRQGPTAAADALKIERWNDAAVRNVLQDTRGPLCVVTPDHTRLEDVASHSIRAAPLDIARFGFSVAHAIHANAPEVEALAAPLGPQVPEIARALLGARAPLIIAGMTDGEPALLEAAANIAWALRLKDVPARLVLVVPDPNTVGLALLGGENLAGALEALRGKDAGLIVLEEDLFRHAPAAEVEQVLRQAKQTVVLDSIRHRTTDRSDVLLPAASFAEMDGTFVNYEGRAQRFFQVFLPEEPIQSSWRWLVRLMREMGCQPGQRWEHLDDVLADLAAQEPHLSAVLDAAPSAKLRIAGQRIPRQPPRASGRTAEHAAQSIHEPMTPVDSDTALSFSMEGTRQQPPSSLTPFFWSPGWNSIQAINKYQAEIAGPLRGGAPGARLFKPDGGPTETFFHPPKPITLERSERWLVPGHHIFGSELLSSLAPGVASLSPKPYIALRPGDAGELGVSTESKVTVTLASGERLALPVVLNPALAPSVVKVGVGLEGQPRLLPATKAIISPGEPT